MQSQMATLNSPPAGGMPQTGANGGATDPSGAQAAGPPAPTAPPLQQTYQSALRDYNSAKYDLAISEFNDVIKYYPRDDLAGNSQYYIAEISYRQGKYNAAIKGYDAVLEQFPGNPKAPAAQLRKGDSLLALNQRDAGTRELRSLIQRYPQTPEAQQARARLNSLGVRIQPKPTAAHDQ
jgi:tol-pal system protein YbgF